MARVYGFPGFEYAMLPHPVASLDATQIQQRARELMPELLRILGVGGQREEAAPAAVSTVVPTAAAAPPVHAAALRNAMELRDAAEHYADRGWTDGLPVVPVTESSLRPFLAMT